ncbi:hypothetical protein EV421DRAFT_1659211, partial [Armillaria borealis]
THRHGLFTAINVGLSYGKGQPELSMLNIDPTYANFITRLVLLPSVQRIAGFASASFHLWSPRLFAYYQDHLSRLHERLGTSQLFPLSIFPCAAFNFGGNVWTFKHEDVLNYPFGWCAITALGRFDSTTGAHLVLWELRMIIEFPHTATVFILSATITHSNIAPATGDQWLLFTQFCAEGLLRWVDNGF